MNAVIIPGKNKYLDLVQTQVLEYLEGERKDFTIPLNTPGTEFQQSVWKVLQQIPYGETWSYKQQAIKLNNPKAVRAVATANGYNRIAFIIPCHRVIGSNGELTGYRGGLDRKKWLLDLEQNFSK
ncbi:MAG: methylated-DNA--[protein]-cysteine S-methyltransferase [Methanosarcinales archaeon]|nr:methylated-DNA--[protein]-cysteine S-methyltransferase [Methanosarcinales archaeon]